MSEVGLLEEFRFFQEHVIEWSKDKERYRKWALIKGRELVGVFDTFNEAVAQGFELFGLELFFVSEIHPDADKLQITPFIFNEFLDDRRPTSER